MRKFNAFFIGVGGEGVLTSAVMVAKAAHAEGYYVRGVQLHGLAQRGGSIPTEVRFGSEKNISSPGIMAGDADLVVSFEPLEAVRACYYANKKKTSFVIENNAFMPIYANLLDVPYPSMNDIVRRIKPFAKKVMVFNTAYLAEKEFGNPVLGNTMMLGVAVGAKLLPLKPKSFHCAIKELAPRMKKENIKAFDRGIELGKRGK